MAVGQEIQVSLNLLFYRLLVILLFLIICLKEFREIHNMQL